MIIVLNTCEKEDNVDYVYCVNIVSSIANKDCGGYLKISQNVNCVNNVYNLSDVELSWVNLISHV